MYIGSQKILKINNRGLAFPLEVRGLGNAAVKIRQNETLRLQKEKYISYLKKKSYMEGLGLVGVCSWDKWSQALLYQKYICVY